MRRRSTIVARPAGRGPRHRFRVGPWRGDASIAHLAPSAGYLPDAGAIHRQVDELAAQGYRCVLTSALTVAEQAPFLTAGFVGYERLHLLRRELDRVPDAPRSVRHRRGRPRDQQQILDVDGRAFDAFWRLDRTGLLDALGATPSSRLRVVDAGGVVGYAITGRAGPVAYLQRLAVDPRRQRHGVGTALVADCLRWSARRGALACMVNTQERNVEALRLYQRLGFVRQRHGLAVLRLDLAPPGLAVAERPTGGHAAGPQEVGG